MDVKEFTDLKRILDMPGWQVVLKIFQEEYDKTYKKLRGAGTGKEISDKNLNYVNGMLTGIERCIKKPQTVVDSFIEDNE